MNTIPQIVADRLVDPVSLRPVAINNSASYVDLRSGGLSRKNEEEIAHFRRTFQPLAPADKLYASRIKSLPRHETHADELVLDMGCGPYDCLSAMPGVHVFLDDIMNLYVDELGANFGGTPVCARTELMPFADDSFDIVYSINMIDHVDDMVETVREMHRVLKNSGRIYCQSYFNSHPLLDTEPGVLDRWFLDEYVFPIFDVEYIQTYSVGDPNISSSYTMDIVGMVLTKKEVDWTSHDNRRKPRDRYERSGFFGPQSHISIALGHLSSGAADEAEGHIDALVGELSYELHHQLLTSYLDIVRGNLADANERLKGLRSHPRVRRNAYARLALADLQVRRIAASDATVRGALARLKQKLSL